MLSNIQGRETKHLVGLKQLHYLDLENVGLQNIDDLTRAIKLRNLQI